MSCRSALLLIALGAVLASAQTADDVTRETQRLRTQVDQERRLGSADSARQSEWRAQGKERLATMRAEASRLARERDSLRRFIDRKVSAPPPPPPTASGARKRKDFAVQVAARIDVLLARLADDPDASGSRSDLEALSRSLKAGNTDASEGLARLFEAWAEAIDAEGRVTAHVGTHTTATGRAMRGTYLTVGRRLQIFVDPTGEFASIRTGTTGAWEEIHDARKLALVRNAADKVAGNGDPGWAWVPVSPIGGAP